MIDSLRQSDSWNEIWRQRNTALTADTHKQPATVPVVEVVKELVELAPGCKSSRLGDQLVIGVIKLGGEASKHGSNGQVKLMVAIKGGWVVDNWGHNREGG